MKKISLLISTQETTVLDIYSASSFFGGGVAPKTTDMLLLHLSHRAGCIENFEHTLEKTSERTNSPLKPVAETKF